MKLVRLVALFVLMASPACHLIFPFDSSSAVDKGAADVANDSAADRGEKITRIEGGVDAGGRDQNDFDPRPDAPTDLPQWLDVVSPKYDLSCSDWGSVCPPQCTNGCACGVCKLACVNGCICPPGWSCEMSCSAGSPCSGEIDCSKGLDCKIWCGVQQCDGLITCGTGYCDVFCDHSACSGGIDCNGACGCNVGCFATGSTCQGTIICLPGCDKTIVKGCHASAGACNQC